MTSLLSRPPEEAVRLIALTLLSHAEDAAARLLDQRDPEALHDFRVALRRLRSVLRAYRGSLQGSLRRRHRRRLAALARSTGPGRDAEVAVEWLLAQRGQVEEGERAGLEWLLRRFEQRRGHGYDAVRGRLAEELAPLAAELQERLGVYTRQVHLGGGGRRDLFGELVGSETVRAVERLEGRLEEVGGAGDEAALHQARLAAKRLRYLLEPLQPEMAAVGPILSRLRGVQELLGELNDAHVLEREMASAAEAAARERARRRLAAVLEERGNGAPAPSGEEVPDPVDGLLALARRNRRRRERLFAELAAGWLGDDEAAPQRCALVTAVRDLARWLEAGFSPPPPASAASAPQSAP